MKNSLKKLFVSLVLACFSGVMYAQDYGNQVIQQSTSALKNLVTSIVSLLQIITALGAFAALVVVIFKMMHGEQDAAKKIAWWVGGFTIGFVLLIVVKNVAMGLN